MARSKRGHVTKQQEQLAALEADLLAQETKVRRGVHARRSKVHTKTAQYRRISKHKRDWRDES